MYDFAIVGAGPSGLCIAKTILECNPDADVKLIDSNKTVGGVWATENLYPGLKTNNTYGTIDFSDFPMHHGFGIKPGQHVSGEAMHNYLQAYAQRSNILPRIDFETRVLAISRLDDRAGWNLRVRQGADERDLQTRKLIIATGVTNAPNRPSIEGASDFEAPILHSAELGLKSGLLTKDLSEKKTVAVLGGGKSAYDAVYLAACTGHQVEWIIRKSGKGPVWVPPRHTNIGPFKVLRESLTTRRIISFLSPCIWQDGFGWLRHFFHFTGLGRKITQKFWANVHASSLDDCGIAKEDRLKILEPETSPFWYGTASGIYNYEIDLYDLIKRGQVKLHREDISHLTAHRIHLANGATVAADGLITATGFSAKPTMNFVQTTIHSDLGIPTTSLTQSQDDFWKELDQKADLVIASKFPRLLVGPYRSPSSTVIQPYNPGLDLDFRYTPFRLYRGIAPPGLTFQGDHSLIFIGMFSNVASTIRLELQCLWAYAYLTNHLKIDRSSVFDETALMSRYSKHRSPYGHGRFFPDVVFDQVPYFDTLLRDLGLPTWRKGNIFKEIFSSYRTVDYKGVVRQWLAKRETGSEKKPLWGTSTV